MKNFTNNFKQFTSRLSARWLIMAFMLFLGIGNAFAYTVYFVNVPNWTNVYVHQWNGGTATSWPGTKLTTKESYKIGGYDVYKANIGNNASFIFNNNSGAQTSDLSVNDGLWYYDGYLYDSREAAESAAENTHTSHGNIAQFSVANSDVIYFNATGTNWTSCYMYIGHASYSKQFTMSRVEYTKNLWKGTSFGTWSDAKGWYFTSETWDDLKNGKGDCLFCKACYHGANTFLMPYKTDFTSGNVYKASQDDQAYATKECESNAWSWSTTVDTYSSSLSVSITNKVGTNNTANAGTVTVKKWNSTTSSAGSAYNTSFLSTSAATGSGNTGYLTALRVTLTPASGYQLEKLVVGSTDVTSSYNTNLYYDIEVTAATTIVATWKRSCETVAKEQYPMSPTIFTYNGLKQVPTITPASGAGAVTSTVYKLNNTTTVANPTDAGTYTVYVNSSDGTTYCGASSLNIGTFTINKKSVAKEQYSMSATTFTYNGSKQVPTITPATGAGAVTSIVYKLNNTTTVVNPTDAGTYTVYVTSNAGTNYTAASSLNIGTFTINKKTVAKGQYPMSPTTFTYNGSKQVPTITPAAGAGAVTSTVYKLNNTTTVANPTDAGTYTVYVTSSAGTNYTAASSLNIGTFTINKKTVAKEQYSMSPTTFSYNGSKQVPTITPAAGAGAVTSTVYKLNNTTTVANPTDAGTYTVYVTSSAGTNYTAASNLNIGTFTINEVCNPISNLTWTITSGAKATYCPGDEVTVTMTYNGTTAKAYDWGGNYNGNIGISGGSIASGAQYTMTINKSGTVNLTLTGCDGETATTTTLEFTTHEAPATPTIAFSVNPVGQSKETILSIASYNANNNYIVYRSADNAVGNDTEVGTYTAPMSISHNNTGSYYYYAKATNKSCDELTATSAIVKLDVQEIGAIIAALGDLKVDPNDPVDFVAMYVKNDGLAYYTDQGATKVEGYTWQFNDGTGWKDCASTNTAAGVDYDVLGMENGSSKCNNFRPNVRGDYRCKVTYDVGEQISNILTVKADATTERTFKGVSMTLPVISVNTGAGDFPVNDFGGTPSKNASSDKMKKKISVDVKIFDKGAVVYDRKARMNYRGSSSMNFLKKSYAFVTGKEKTKNEKGDVDTGKANLLGVGNAEDKDWVLYAAAADPSLMRNRLMFDTFRDMTGGWSVNSRYVELVVNGKYKGVYVLMDKITANEKRVNVAWKQDINGNTTQEGFIVKFDKTDIVDRYEITSGDQKTFKSTYSGHDGLDTYDTQIDQRFEIEYPEKEDIEEEDLDNNKGAGDWSVVFNSIKDKFNKFEKELKAGNFTEVQKLIDYTSWADWFIITEFGKNIDGYRASNFFVYDGSKANAKIEARPLWDQELSFNNQCPGYYNDYAAASTSGLLIKDVEKVYTDNCSAPFWFTGKYTGGRGTYNGSNQQFKGLLDDPCFVAEVQARWAIHTGANGALTSNALTTKMKGYLADLDKDHVLNSSTITKGTPLDREINVFWNGKSRKTIDCGTQGNGTCLPGKETGYTDQGFHSSKTNLNNWLTGNRRTNLGNIINGWEGSGLNISLTVTPDGGEITPWEAVMVQVNNPSGYEYELEYTTGELNKVDGVIIQESNDKYTYRIPRPADWGYGNGERDDEEYVIKATLKVAEGEAQCGNSTEAPTATATIKLTDEEDDANCEIK